MKTSPDFFPKIRILIFLMIPVTCFFFWRDLLDDYEVSRFTLLSGVMALGVLLLFPFFKARETVKIHLFDGVFVAYYLISVASAAWASLPSESIFGAQKVFLAFLVYFFFREFLSYDYSRVRRSILLANLVYSILVVVFLLVELAKVGTAKGLSNEALYTLSGITGHKSLTALVLLLQLPFTYLSLSEYKHKIPILFLISLQVLCILILQVRSVYLGLFFGAGILLIYQLLQSGRISQNFLKKFVPVAAIVLLLAGGAIATQGNLREFAGRINPFSWEHLNSGSGAERQFVWYKTRQLIRDNWETGVGVGNWKIVFPSTGLEGAWRLQEKDLIFTRVHNDFLEVFSETGVGGFLLYLMLFGLAFAQGIRKLIRAKGPEKQEILLLLLGLLGYVIFAFLNFPKERIELLVLLSLYFALLLRYENKPEKGVTISLNASGKLLAVAALLLVLLGMNLYIGISRWNSEIHIAKAIFAQRARQWSTLVKESKMALHPFYQVETAAIPVIWYEGVGYSQINKPEEMYRCFKKAYAVNPYNFHVVNNFASSQVQKERFQDAIALYKKALSINPKFEDGLFNISYCYLRLNEPEEALNWLNQTKNNPEKKAVFLAEIEKLQALKATQN